MGWLINEGPKWTFLFLWMGTNIGLFIGYFFEYYLGIEFYYLIEMLGLALPFARASAAVLNFNCLLILLPVCRNLLSLVRGSCTCCHKNIRRILDKNITFHKLCAYMIIIQTAIHFWAHTFNFEYFMVAREDTGLLSTLSNLEDDWINPIRPGSTNPMLELVKTVAGITGVVITLALIVMYSSSTEVLRRSYFEVFWYTHHLFVIFFIGCIAHGFGGTVRSQTNTADHDPEVCKEKYDDWGKDSLPECPTPIFGPGTPKTWRWVIGPLVIYLFERCLRFYRSQQTVVIYKAIKHPSKVMELQLMKKDFKMLSGQYIFLHCPSISRLEWHPFTLTSSPQEEYFSVHIRMVGDWTNELAKLCLDGDEFKQSGELPKVAVDGPFGTASEDIFDYEVDVLVGAGIGVTPFAAVLKDIWYRYLDPTYDGKLRKLYFYWICPDTNAFEWFNDLLKEMENQMAEAGKAQFLNYNIYLTRGWNPNDAINIITREEDETDVITGLKQKTFYGRPNWDQQFRNIARDNAGSTIGVFFCGPKVLSSQLHKMCNNHTDVSRNTRFSYNKENF